MPLVLKKSVKQLVDEALTEIETLSVDDARALLGRPDVRARMGASGGEYVRQNYHWRDVVRRFVAQVYGE